jgi:transposase
MQRSSSSSTPSSSGRGGKRAGAGRPTEKEKKTVAEESIRNARNARQVKYEQRQDLLQQHNELSNPRGRSSSYHENKLLLVLIIGYIVHYGMNQTSAIHTAATLVGRSDHTLHSLYHHWLEHKEVLEVNNSNRGGGSLLHINHDHHLSIDHICTIHRVILERNAAGPGCTTNDIKQQLLQQHTLSISKQTLRSVLHSIGYCYGRSRFIGTMNDEARKARIRAFIKQYSAALQAQQRGECIIVYTDESYINSNHSSSRTWYSPLSSTANEVKRSIGKGKRLILLHALSKDGLLVLHRNNQPVLASSNIDEEKFSAELVFEAVEHDGDYHKNMHGDIFLAWLLNRLFPTFQRLYPGKKLVLVLDNATYHHARGEDFINPNEMDKTQIAYKLVEFGIREINIARGSNGAMKRFGQASFYQRGGKWAPTLDEMKRELKRYLALHPEYQQTEVQKLFKERGYQLIYTPPSTPNVQPIELVWAYVKNYVARQYESGRSLETLRRQTREGFYGQPNLNHEGVTANLSRALIKHCHKWCNDFIDQDWELEGTVEQLSSGEEVQAEAIELSDDIDNELDPFIGELEDSEEEDEEA